MGKEKLKLLIQDKNLFPIIPLQDYKNVPYVKWSKEENRIKSVEEYENYSNKNCTGYSLLTGKASGIMVIDLDVNHGNSSINGINNFNEFIEDLATEYKEIIYNTFSVKSPNGGTHLYFKYRKGLKNKAEYIPGVDIRTDGGIITLPYTKRKLEEGNIKEYGVLNNNDIQEMPKSLFDKFVNLHKRNNPSNDFSESKTNIDKVEFFSEGSRNDSLFKYAIAFIDKSNIRDENIIKDIIYALNLYKCKPPMEEQRVDSMISSIIGRLKPSYCDEKGIINAGLLSEYVLNETPCYTKGNLWYKYNNEKGVYEYLEFKQVQRMFFDYIVNVADKRTPNKPQNFAKLLMLISEDAREVHDEKKYINCLSGVIDIENNKILKHDSKYKTEIQFQAQLIQNPKEYQERFDKSEFKKFLNDLLDDESILTLQESWGLMLSPHAKEVQNCFIYKGEGSNGKSVTFDIQEALINNSEKICGIGLGDFGGDFVISSAEGKHVNIVRDDELSGKTVHKFFKSMVTGEPVTVNRKNKDLVRLGFNITHFFGLNRLPSAADKSTGFFRRPIIIPFNNSFGTYEEVAKGLRDKVKDTEIGQRIIDNELDIVFTWAYEGLQRVKANKWKVTISKAAESEMEEYREEVDSAYAFYNERIVKAPLKNQRIEKKKVYDTYLDWCSDNGITYMNNVQFGRQLSSFGLKSKVSNSIRYWLDIELIDLELIKDNTNPFA
ncbi:phage/plasmid primase, P4 family [Clostridium botulinum]|uniref:phage/plasmid primase, P4 family n=1 Tax=Clostridium botulinum TaxID=1491 RepID=UPI000774A349|nr:phage/plasmid primase, P4 family [Clostridium botulinum]MBY6931279.1 bifunctional DNA primase/polymerase [Clostridium botulinum]NFG19800.1 DNA primase [Clostridium botulinum]NFO79878.1 DNA primase [Clostridium botulinum]